MRKLSYQGSVKNIYELGQELEFEFSDRFSIFDWGEMPDSIADKGKNLNTINDVLTKYLSEAATYKSLEFPDLLSLSEKKELETSMQFQNLKKYGALTHFKKIASPNSFIGKKLHINHPEFINGKYLYENQTLLNTLIPLEVVFRFGAPSGSSYLKRNPKVQADEFFDSIIIELYTKLEKQDRLLDRSEALQMTGLSASQISALENLTKIYACALYNKFTTLDFTLWDGKFEFALDNKGRLILIDSIGPDELRLTRKGISYSKQVLRDFYKDSEWLRELESLKKLHPQDFKEQMQTQPVNLTEEQKEISSYIYTAIAKSLLENDSYQNKRIDQKLAKLYQNIIIFGKGAREHALAKYISRQKGVNKVYVIPGNPGMSEQKISTLDIVFDDYAHFCQHKNISWAIIGPEDLLKKGLSDLLNQNNIPCFAPSKIASELETSKAFSKKLMQKYQIPTASFETFKNIDSATSYIRSQSFEKIVVKQSSLAAGKGVIICESKTDAIKAAQELLRVDTEIVIEEFLTGREVSLFVLCHGVHFQILGDACDYKRLLDQDKGPNTGGMGCYSPAYWLEKSQLEDIKQTIIKPTLSAMMSEQRSFKGMLFIGLMMTDEGPKVLEYNTRFGDPETQTLLPRVRSGLFEVMRSIAFDDLDEFKKAKITLDPQYSLHVVKAAKGYPGIHEKICSGDIIENKYIRNSHSEIFFAGVAAKDEILLTSGGRILGLTSLGCDLKTAREQVYAEISKITFKGEQFRGDIGL